MTDPGTETTAKGTETTEEGTDVVIGRNPVLEALRADRPVERLFVASDTSSGPVAALLEEARRRGIVVQRTDRRQLDRMAAGKVHQGVVAVAAPVQYAELDEVFAAAESKGEDPFVLVLDEIQDPHNLGSLLRSADGAGVHGVLVPARRSAGLTMTVARTSAGAVHYVPVVQATNIARTLTQLKERGLWVVGADMSGPEDLWGADLQGPVALVVGGEGKGLGRLVRETCDFVVRIPTVGRVNSLNAGVAGALLMFEVARRRRARGADADGSG